MPHPEIEARAFRSAEILDFHPPNADRDGITVEVSFSSETPYFRWDYWEVLGHAPGEVDLSILQAGAPVLKDHIPSIDAKVGRVVRAWLQDGRGRAVLSFAATPEARDLAARVAAGEVTDISVGYDIRSAKRDGTRDGVPVIRVTDWLPREISWVAVPADPSVGHGRSDTPHRHTIPITDTDNPEDTMPDPIQTQGTAIGTAPDTAPVHARAADPAAIRAEAERIAADMVAGERTRIAEIEAIAAQAGMSREVRARAISAGTTVDAFRAEALAHMASPEATRARAARAEIGLTGREVRSFSFARLAAALADPNSRDAQDAAAFELEVCREGNRARGTRAKSSLTIPMDILADPNFILPRAGTRAAGPNAMTTGAAADGGALVPVDYMAGSFIDALTNSLSVTRAGVTVMSGLTGDVDIPRETGGATFGWVSEGGDAPSSKPQVGTVSLVPHTAAAEVEYTRRMRLQADPSVDAFLRRVVMRDVTLGIDATCLRGHAAAGAPYGILNLVTPTTWTTASTMTRDEIIDLATGIAAANVTGEVSMILNAVSVGAGRKTKLDAGSGRFLLEGDRLADYPFLQSNQAQNYEVFAGVWENAILALWSGLDIRVDTASRAASDGVVIRVFQDLDFQVRHAAAFAVRKN